MYIFLIIFLLKYNYWKSSCLDLSPDGSKMVIGINGNLKIFQTLDMKELLSINVEDKSNGIVNLIWINK